MKHKDNMKNKMNTKLLASISVLMPVLATVAFSGKANADYAASCAGCHGPLASSNKAGSSASKIKNAIQGVGMMAGLASLTDDQINAIAVEIGGSADLPGTNPTPNPTPDPNPTPNPTPDPNPTTCTPPETLVNGVCAVTPPTANACEQMAQEYAYHKAHEKGQKQEDKSENEDDSNDDNQQPKAKATELMLSAPGKQVIHAEQVLKLGIAASGDDRHIKMGINLPKGARFTEGYNSTLQAQQGVVNWQVPKNAEGKTISIKFCAKAQDNATPSDAGVNDSQNMKFVMKEVLVQVLPKLNKPLIPSSVVTDTTITNAVYNKASHKLKLSGQVKWSKKATAAARKAAMTKPVQLHNALNARPLGAAKVKPNGAWAVSIPVPNGSVPGAVDAIFQGRLDTKPVKQ